MLYRFSVGFLAWQQHHLARKLPHMGINQLSLNELQNKSVTGTYLDLNLGHGFDITYSKYGKSWGCVYDLIILSCRSRGKCLWICLESASSLHPLTFRQFFSKICFKIFTCFSFPKLKGPQNKAQFLLLPFILISMGHI